jgi:ketose-bisphosphate aldolase
MLTTLHNLLETAEAGKYAVVAPDFPSLFVARILMEYAEETATPLILSYATLFKPMRDVRSYRRFIQVLREEIDSLRVPIALHLDHATRLEEIAEAIDVGFTSVMIDASSEPYPVNLERTQQVVALAHPADISVEAELGHVASSLDYIQAGVTPGFLTDPDLAVGFVTATEIDALAVAIGTVHGAYQGEPILDFGRLASLHQRLPVPLVLHGASGLGNENIRKAVALGIRKINVYSELIGNLLFETQQALAVQTTNPLKVANAQVRSIQQVIAKYISASGSLGVGKD